MNGPDEGGERLVRYSAAVVGVGLVGVAAAYLLPQGAEDRLGVFLGVGASTFTGLASLLLKHRALSRSVGAGMKVVGVVFFLRLIAAAVGLVWVSRRGFSPIPFTIGFFGVYFVLQWIEIGYILAAAKERR